MTLESSDFNEDHVKEGFAKWCETEQEINAEQMEKFLTNKVDNPKTIEIEKIVLSQDIHQVKEIRDRFNEIEEQLKIA